MILRQMANCKVVIQIVRKLVFASKLAPQWDYKIGVQYNFCTKIGWRELLLNKVQPLKKYCDIENFQVLVVCGPSGSGKSTLIQRLFKEYPTKFGFSVSHTTRKPRDGEIHGQHYYFTKMDDMKTAIEMGEFLETATFSGNIYGTSLMALSDVCKSGKICILDIEMEGVKQVKKTDLNPIFIFIKPPSMFELEKRLRARGTETEDSLNKRLTRAKTEMDFGEIEGNFHKIIVNDDLEMAYSVLIEFIKSELTRRNVLLD